MIGDSAVNVDESSEVIIRGKQFKGPQGLWELLTRKNVKPDLITATDLKR